MSIEPAAPRAQRSSAATPTLRVHGEPLPDPTAFAQAMQAQDFHTLQESDRDFAAVLATEAHDFIVTSAAGAQPYFIARSGGRVFHGRTVAEVARALPTGWEWDFDALAEYLLTGLITGGRTLHRRVSRIGRGRWISISDDGVDTREYAPSPFDTAGSNEMCSADALLSVLRDEVASAGGRDVRLYLSASGGLDARVLLAALFALGRSADLIVSGGPSSTDRRIVSELSTCHGLRTEFAQLSGRSFLEAMETVCEATGGALPLDHWYGFLHLSHIPRGKEAAVLMGIGGEACRSQYFDAGILSLALNVVPLAYRHSIVRRRMAQRGLISRCHFDEFQTPVADRLHFATTNGMGARNDVEAEVLHASPRRLDWLTELDRFFVEEDLAHAQGLQLLGAGAVFEGAIVNPFLRSRFLRRSVRLSRSMKLGSRFHRTAIHRLAPALLNIPEASNQRPISRRPQPFYWWNRAKGRTPTSYVDTSIFADQAFDALFEKHRDSLSGIISEELAVRLSCSKTRQPADCRLFWALLPLALFMGQTDRQSRKSPRQVQP